MDYREYPVRPELAPFVSRVWTLTGESSDPDSEGQPVLPDGHPELVLHLGDAFERAGVDGRSERQPRVLFAGQLQAQLMLRPTGRIAVVGVRLRPFGAGALFRVPQHQIVGLTPAVDELRADLGRALSRIVAASDDVNVSAAWTQEVLRTHIDSARISSSLRAAVDGILHSGGRAPIETIAQQTGITRRHLERIFLDGIGLTPKRLARIVRFQRALRLLERSRVRAPGVRTAAACGYTDQAHFIREFRALAGCSPTQYLLQRPELTGFFVDDPARQSQPSATLAG